MSFLSSNSTELNYLIAFPTGFPALHFIFHTVSNL